MSDQQKEKVNWIGVSLLVIGVAFLYRKLDWQFLDLPDFIYSWEYILVVIGSILLLTGNRGGIAVLLVGLFFIFTEEFLYIFREFHDYWPVLLIIIGISMLVRSSRRSSKPGKLNNGTTQKNMS